MRWGNNLAIHFGWLIAIGAVATTGRADNEFVAISGEDYGNTGRCSADPLTNANEDGLYVDDALSNWYDQVVYQTNGLYDGRDFMDAVNWAAGADESDPYGSDFADVMFLSGHAGSDCTSGSQRVWNVPADSGDGCTIYLAHKTSASRHSTFGGANADADADVLVTYACQTTQYCVYTSGAFVGLSKSTGQFNMLNGFHGDVAEVAGYQTDLSNYSYHAAIDAIGEAWIDDMYSTYSGGENCPASIGWGSSTSVTDNYFALAGWADLKSNGSRTTTKYYYLCSCDPVNASALPAC